MSKIEVGSVIQMSPDFHWGPVFVVVTEVRSWGYIGYMPVPSAEKSTAPIRISRDKEFVAIGQAEWVAKWAD